MIKKNILIIGNYPPPYGGVPHHIERLTEYLVEKGWTCHILSGGSSGNAINGSLFIYKPRYSQKLISFVRQIFNRKFNDWVCSGTLNHDEPNILRHYKIYADIGSQIIRKHDISLIASYNLLSNGPIGAFLAHQFKLPHVINVFGEVYKFKSMHKNKKFFVNVIGTANRLLSCSSHCGRSIQLLGSKKPVQTVTYGVDINHFAPGESPDLKKKLGIGSSPIVLFVGRLDREMGLDSFLAAAQLITKTSSIDVRFLMVGQSGDLADEVEKECEISNGKLLMRRNSTYADLPNYYRLASIVVVPTRGERTCSSLAAMEAMATRKAVVGFAIGGIPEIIDHERTGLLVEPEDIQGLADAINRLLNNESQRMLLADEAYRESQVRFDEIQVNATVERYFLDALGGT